MMTDKRREERIAELTDELGNVLPKRKTNAVAELLADNEYRKERFGTWLPDTSFESKKFVRWICSACNHWQSANRTDGMRDKIFYMNYCPFCGAQMEKPERDTL